MAQYDESRGRSDRERRRFREERRRVEAGDPERPEDDSGPHREGEADEDVVRDERQRVEGD